MNLKEYLRINSISQLEFSKKIGISESALRYIINENRDLGVSTAFAIEKATNGEVTARDMIPKKKRIKTDK